MKKILLLLLLSTIFEPSAMAQSWVSKTAKSVFTLTTFRADGSLIASTTGFYAGDKGECISSFTPFNGASSAVIVDGSGKKYNVTTIIACDATYDVCRFICDNAKSTPIKIAEAVPAQGEEIYVLPYAIKNAQTINGSVKNMQQVYEKYNYYTLSLQLPQNTISAPVLNVNGELIGIAQAGTETDCYAADVRLAVDLKPEPIQQQSLSVTTIPALLPSDQEQAMIALFFSQQKSRDNYERTLAQFVHQFPTYPDGYVRQAQLAADKGEFDKIDPLFQKALSCSDDKAIVYNDYSRLIASLASKAENENTTWTFERALAEIDKALQLSQQPIYYYQRATVLMQLERWRDAVLALNEYEKSIPATALDDEFYHLRFLAEQQSKMYQQAIDDINKSIQYNSHSLLYHVEKTQLLIRLNLLEEALHAAEETIATDATFADGYMLLGIIQCQLGNKEEGLVNLQFAKEKGSQQADNYIEKYK